MVITPASAFFGVLAAGAVIGSAVLFGKWQTLRRAEYIRTFKWPAGLLARLEKHHPGFSRKDSALVSRGLRQFFLAHLMSGKRYVSMPSQAADDLWHEFILYTREYDAFCRRAFGTFLHHTPAVVLVKERRRSNEGLRRVWWYCCKYENIDPVRPTRLPLLFALDAKLNIANGFVYHTDCEALRRSGIAGSSPYCGGDFSDSSIDGSSAGFGDAGSDGSHDGDGGGHGGGDGGGGDGGGGGDSGGGCGGGCGGGGGD
ncbi:hypothetical protein [Bradyrhizobium sp. NAS96.2]|uniref:glycine-rich domain-containing protein n=1 Tax=Bradyrhizobium sp. NAS96.2 TaxID=1680160 RepID=UPI000A9E2914|nr:hypothetical protein [Bradyrhizobium sp. NAS96.2]